MPKTRFRIELPAKYNESECKLGRSRTAMYREENGNWFLVVDLDLLSEKKK